MTNKMSKEKQIVSVAWDEVRVGIVQILFIGFSIFIIGSALLLSIILPFALVDYFL